MRTYLISYQWSKKESYGFGYVIQDHLNKITKDNFLDIAQAIKNDTKVCNNKNASIVILNVVKLPI